MKQSFIHKPD